MTTVPPVPPSIAAQLLETAQRAGAVAAEVFIARSLNRPVLFEANALKQIETRDSEGIALRLWHQDCPGLAVAYGGFDPEQLVTKALELSQLNAAEPVELTTLPPDLCDEQYGQPATVQQLIQWGNEALAQLTAPDFQDLQCVLELDSETATTELYNSKGFACRYTEHTLSIYSASEWVRGEDLLCVEAEQTQRNTLDISQFTAGLIHRLRWAKNYSPPPIGRHPVLFTARAAEVLWSTVEAALNSKRVIEGASPWSGRLQEAVMSPLLNLRQDPTIGPFSCPFDDEGINTRRVEFVRNGVLQIFYTDRTTGRLLGCGSTGNGFRPGLEHYPSPGLFNLMVTPGLYSFEALVNTLENGLIVDQVLGNVGSISGDFAVNVDLGYRVKQGKIVGRVKDTLVSGNVYEALNQVIAVGQDAAWYGSVSSPSILVEGLSITA